MTQRRTARSAGTDVNTGARTRHLKVAIATLLLALTAAISANAGVAASSPTAAPTPQIAAAHGFEQFLHRYEAANTAFVNGDPSLWLAMTAQQDPVSIFGGFGGSGEAGLEQVDQRYQLAARAFLPSGAEVDFEYLVKDVRGRLAYTVAIERADVVYAGHTEPQPQALRVTMIFRFDRGAWTIVHRHADTMIDLQLPTP
jgi:SnoaL-like domain